MGLTLMKRQAEAHLGWEGADVADVAMQSEESYTECCTIGERRKIGRAKQWWQVVKQGCRQSDHTEQLSSSGLNGQDYLAEAQGSSGRQPYVQ